MKVCSPSKFHASSFKQVQRALQEVLYAGGGEGKLTPERLAVLINSAMGVVAESGDGVFVDFDTMPEDGVSLQQALRCGLLRLKSLVRLVLATLNCIESGV